MPMPSWAMGRAPRSGWLPMPRMPAKPVGDSKPSLPIQSKPAQRRVPTAAFAAGAITARRFGRQRTACSTWPTSPLNR